MVWYYNVSITHFMAGVTDFIVALACLLFFCQLVQSTSRKASNLYFKIHFLLLAIATFIGGFTGHIWQYELINEWKLPGWLLSMLAITILERAVIKQAKLVLANNWVKSLLVFNLIELCLFGTLAVITISFQFIEYHAAYGLLFVIFGVGLLQLKKGVLHINLFLGILMSMLAALVFQCKLSINVWVNHLAISHIVLVFSSYFFYRQAIVRP